MKAVTIKGQRLKLYKVGPIKQLVLVETGDAIGRYDKVRSFEGR